MLGGDRNGADGSVRMHVGWRTRIVVAGTVRRRTRDDRRRPRPRRRHPPALLRLASPSRERPRSSWPTTANRRTLARKAAEDEFRQAVEIAQAQESKWFELRATIGLARLLLERAAPQRGPRCSRTDLLVVHRGLRHPRPARRARAARRDRYVTIACSAVLSRGNSIGIFEASVDCGRRWGSLRSGGSRCVRVRRCVSRRSVRVTPCCSFTVSQRGNELGVTDSRTRRVSMSRA